jgi:GT2 family glycosyltransferase
MDSLPNASVIVCTVDRLQHLEMCLESLAPFARQGAEVVVVNNGPYHAEVSAVAAPHAARLVDEPRRGLGHARNRGTHAARGEFIAFIDDDARAAPNWLPRLIAPFSDPEVYAVAGAVAADPSPDPVLQAFARLYRAGLPRDRATLEAVQDPTGFPLRLAMQGIGMNMAFRREAFERFGYFDERFGRGARVGDSEETDRFFALLRGGVKIVFEPSATVIHSFPTDRRAFRRSLFHAGCGHTALLTKCFLEEPDLRWKVVRYIVSRLGHRRRQPPDPDAGADFPRLPLVLGSLYGPLAFLLSGKARR